MRPMIDSSSASYEELSSEYYNPLRHPTCANLREASALVLRRWLPQLPFETATLCDVGAGKSLLAELLAERGIVAEELLLVDSSRSMLAYSSQWDNARTRLILAEASKLPLAQGSVDLLVSSLGDPYNTPDFWQEVRRVLSDGGRAIFTTPSYAWATSFRSTDSREKGMSARFDLADGRSLFVPSYIYTRAEQSKLIASAGLVVQNYMEVAWKELESGQLSPKLLTERGEGASIVEGYLVDKPGR
jgi:SAM-dependent methyltransferase